jgi:hypothetical protein
LLRSRFDRIDQTGISSLDLFYLSFARSRGAVFAARRECRSRADRCQFFATAHPDVISILVAQLTSAGVWVRSHPDDAAKLLAPIWGLDAARSALKHRVYHSSR